MKVAPAWQTGLFGLCAAGAVLGHAVLQPGLGAQLLMLAPLVALLGLPHGALDLPMAEMLWPLAGWRGKLRFVAFYLGLGACVVGLWILAPRVALAAFLAYSALHFSGDWSHAAGLLRFTGGIATIGAPAVMQHAQVTVLFGYLAPAPAAAMAVDAATLLGGAALLGFSASMLFQPAARDRAALEQAMLWASAPVLPPLVWFAVYFCGLHSIRHFDATIRSLPRAGPALATAAMLSGTTALVAAVMVLARAGNGVELEAGTMQVIFIGLAALTVPHMLLVERFHRHRPAA